MYRRFRAVQEQAFREQDCQGRRGPHRQAPSSIGTNALLRAPVTPALLEHVQRTAGNQAATWLVVQRHEIETPPGELENLDAVVQRLTTMEMDQAEAKVDAAVTAATGISKSRNPILYNTGKAITKGGVATSVFNTNDATWKAQVAGGSKTIRLGGTWVLQKPPNEIQGALAHEVAHILRGPGLDEYQDEFNAYWAEIMAGAPGARTRLRTSAEMNAKLTTIQGLLMKYGWWGTASAAKKQVWGAIAAPTGFNLSNSWKQKALLDLMEAPKPVQEVVTLIGRMNPIDRAEARDARRPNGSYYLAYANYSATDKAAIWRALRGAGAPPA